MRGVLRWGEARSSQGGRAALDCEGLPRVLHERTREMATRLQGSVEVGIKGDEWAGQQIRR